MKKTNEYKYYSIGDCWNFIFDVTGILGFAQGKKTLQKRLIRLAKEEAYSLSSIPKLKEELQELLSQTFGNEELSAQLLAFFDRAVETYIQLTSTLIISFHKRDIVRFLLVNGGISFFSLLINTFLLKIKKNCTPFEVNVDLFLPEFDSNTITDYPLKKVLSYLLRINLKNKSDVSSSYGESSEASERQYLYRLEKGNGKRGLKYLFDNLKPLIVFDNNPELENYFKFIVAVARFSEELCKRFENKEFLRIVISEFKRQYAVQKKMLQGKYSDSDIKNMNAQEWYKFVDFRGMELVFNAEKFKYMIDGKTDDCSNTFEYYRKQYQDETFIREYCKEYGDAVVYFLEWVLTNHTDFPVENSLLEVFEDEKQFINMFNSKITEEEINDALDNYRIKHGVWLQRFPWLLFELESDIASLRHDNEQAKSLILEAFNQGKYSAGRGLKRIIARALELCLICNDKKSFDIVYKWGKFSKYIKPFMYTGHYYIEYEKSILSIPGSDEDAFEKSREYYYPNEN